jgi:hypothetical protein
MAQYPPTGPGADGLEEERARLREAARALEAERERLRAQSGDVPGETTGRRRRRAPFWAPLLDVDPELCEWWRQNRPSRVLAEFLRDVPDEFLDHVRASRRERLLALRSLLDYALDYNERRPARSAERRAREVPIEDV